MREERWKRREGERKQGLVGGQVHAIIRSECSSLPLSQVQFTYSLSQLGEAIVSFLPRGEEGEAEGPCPTRGPSAAQWSARLRCAFPRRASLKPPTAPPGRTAFEAQTGFSTKLPARGKPRRGVGWTEGRGAREAPEGTASAGAPEEGTRVVQGPRPPRAPADLRDWRSPSRSRAPRRPPGAAAPPSKPQWESGP